VTGFSAAWLALREPHDHRARNADVRRALVERMGGRTGLAIVDLACGSGSTHRALSPHLPPGQAWRMIDNDAALLDTIAKGDGVTTVQCDLARDLDMALRAPAHLVVTSALLDLVSDGWLERLVATIARRRLPFYAALSYDGLTTFDPVDPQDDAVVAAVNLHQQGDKGFGPALGPAGAARAMERFRGAGYEIVAGRSDWLFESADEDIKRECVGGWAQAAGETGAPSAEGWQERRLALLGRTRIRVSHVDFVAVPR